jgi:hypothetical protein
MSTPDMTTISARVPVDLRTDLEELARRDGNHELTPVIRAALRQYADARLRPAAVAGGLFENGQEGAYRRRGRTTERTAAQWVAPRIGTVRAQVLALYADAGDHGLTADDVIQHLDARARRLRVKAPAVNGTARRVTDLLQAGMIAPALDEDGHERVRLTRHRTPATVWQITTAGAQAAEELAARTDARGQEARHDA